MNHATLIRSLFAVSAALAIGAAHATPCLIFPIQGEAKVGVADRLFTLIPQATHRDAKDPWPSLELRRCEQVVVSSGKVGIAFKVKEKDGGWRSITLAAGEPLTEARMNAAAAAASPGEAVAQLAAVLRGDSSSQFGLSRGEPSITGMPFGKVLRPAQTWELPIGHATAQTLVLTPPLTSRRQPLTLELQAGEAARVPADFLVPGGIYRWRLERDGKAAEGRFQILDAETQAAVEKSLASTVAESSEHRAMLRALQLDAAGLAYDRDLTASKP